MKEVEHLHGVMELGRVPFKAGERAGERQDDEKAPDDL